MKNEIRKHLISMKEEGIGHPIINNSRIKKVGNKYIYFEYSDNGIIKESKNDLEKFYFAYCI